AAADGEDVSHAVTYEDEAVLASMRTADSIDDNAPASLEAAHQHGTKIMVYHGMQDPAIQFRNDIDFYIRVASHFAGGSGGNPDYSATPDFDRLRSWYRLFLVPNAGHCPTVPNALPALIDWVEQGTAPDSLVEPAVSDAGAGAPGGNGGFGDAG